MDDTVDSGRPGAWLTLREAADRLGISEKTARRRVKAGTLEGRQVSTLHGLAWQVWVDDRVDTRRVAATVDDHGTLDEGGRHTDVPDQGSAFLERVRLVDRELVRLIDRLHEENRALAEAAAVWQTRAELLGIRLDQAHEQLRALEAPKPHQSHKGSRETAETPKPTTEPSDPTSEPTPVPTPTPIPPDEDGRRPWWSRWWPAIVGAGLILGVMVAAPR